MEKGDSPNQRADEGNSIVESNRRPTIHRGRNIRNRGSSQTDSWARTHAGEEATDTERPNTLSKACTKGKERERRHSDQVHDSASECLAERRGDDRSKSHA